jgi:hypothetical protein
VGGGGRMAEAAAAGSAQLHPLNARPRLPTPLPYDAASAAACSRRRARRGSRWGGAGRRRFGRGAISPYACHHPASTPVRCSRSAAGRPRACAAIPPLPDTDKQAVLVDRLSSVIYECRSLERQISKQVICMRGGCGAGAPVPVDASEAAPEERARVEAVVREADGDDYWFHASKVGRSGGRARSLLLSRQPNSHRPGQSPLLEHVAAAVRFRRTRGPLAPRTRPPRRSCC